MHAQNHSALIRLPRSHIIFFVVSLFEIIEFASKHMVPVLLSLLFYLKYI